jgi:hypothetical protein
VVVVVVVLSDGGGKPQQVLSLSCDGVDAGIVLMGDRLVRGRPTGLCGATSYFSTTECPLVPEWDQ